MRGIGIFVFLLMVVFYSNAQKVKSKAYNALLKTILKSDVPEVSIQEADSLKKANSNIIFIDTREKKEYEVSHIEGAVWVGYDDFDLERVEKVDKDAQIIAYCSVGARSEKITRILIEEGYTNVSNLYGSLFEWVNQEKPVVDEHGKPTKKVHAYSRTWGIWLKKGEKVYD